MNRFKFRAWNKYNQEFTKDVSITLNGNLLEIDKKFQCNFVIQQFTDLLDKNGKEIYEGDIVEIEIVWKSVNEIFDKEKVKRLVKWDNIELKWGLECPDLVTFCSNLSDCKDNIKIIGNIFENPHLLDKNEKSENIS